MDLKHKVFHDLMIKRPSPFLLVSVAAKPTFIVFGDSIKTTKGHRGMTGMIYQDEAIHVRPMVLFVFFDASFFFSTARYTISLSLLLGTFRRPNAPLHPKLLVLHEQVWCPAVS